MSTPLVIRKEQMRVFERAGDVAFCRKAADYIRSEYPVVVADLSPNELLAQVELAFERASRFHFTIQASVLGYIVLMFTVAPEFDTHPSIHEILHQDWIPPDARLAYLAEAISPEEWDEARSAGDQTFWQRQSPAGTADGR
jgi:hypothetical protein